MKQVKGLRTGEAFMKRICETCEGFINGRGFFIWARGLRNGGCVHEMSGGLVKRAMRSRNGCTCVTVPTKKKLPILRSNRQLEPPLPLNFSSRIFRHSALAPNFSMNP